MHTKGLQTQWDVDSKFGSRSDEDSKATTTDNTTSNVLEGIATESHQCSIVRIRLYYKIAKKCVHLKGPY